MIDRRRNSGLAAVRRLVTVASVVLAATFASFGIASASPPAAPGVGFGSSGAAPGTSGGRNFVDVTNLDLSQMPEGTKANFTYTGGECLEDPSSRGFYVDSGDYGPFSYCFYNYTFGDYRIVLTTPRAQRVLLDNRYFGFVPTGFVVIGDGVCGNTDVTCSVEEDRTVSATGAKVRPKTILGALPKGPLASWTFCSTEGLPCTAPTGARIAYGTAGTFVERNKGAADIGCDTRTFGGNDPVPGKVKSCFVVN